MVKERNEKIARGEYVPPLPTKEENETRLLELQKKRRLRRTKEEEQNLGVESRLAERRRELDPPPPIQFKDDDRLIELEKQKLLRKHREDEQNMQDAEDLRKGMSGEGFSSKKQEAKYILSPKHLTLDGSGEFYNVSGGGFKLLKTLTKVERAKAIKDAIYAIHKIR